MRNRMIVVEGSYAVAHAVKVCRPNVISAYPITPQTHIVENLSQFVADGEIDCESMNVESEFSAISALIGASAAGARTYSSTTSQGLALMHEALFNASGMRLPIIMTVVNRALSAPINIWNDQQDSIAQRDTGWIQLYAEDVQESADMIPQLYKIAEDSEVLLPAMACMDGFILSHVYEPVILLEQSLTDEFLPSYSPEFVLDPKNPMSFGAFADPSTYTEFRYKQEKAMGEALERIEEVANEFMEKYGRYYGGLIDGYALDDAEIVIMAMGSVIGTVKDTIDMLRSEGETVGLLKVRSFRPFPAEAIRKALRNAKVVITLDKNISIGKNEGALCTEVKACLYNAGVRTPVIGFMLGHGGRDIPVSTIMKIVNKAKLVEKGIFIESEFADLREDLV
ncbi:2-oxoacid:ferredoxin oxidoreductase, alpha subunit [Candidatus Methanoperedens nitroreducens]|uniref:Pyruvate synthase subunit PorA n=1 Tax=Candidatus Methanoperedens nitratireducens TaxID=1392998 RepID=A0A062V809_9EURY|nr:pyruvate synthase subunit PorA [Candidatus Methanoperedens nitroreducens]KCZ71495.1 2-oxoacid:ferredoxin oxidoreductase, alpha subunit [Candidatus Methanoperedens nitroreducens]MDJ1421124.1 pyruvate synthase subunit PorA [Candidatus Methanoperedens sp.]